MRLKQRVEKLEQKATPFRVVIMRDGESEEEARKRLRAGDVLITAQDAKL